MIKIIPTNESLCLYDINDKRDLYSIPFDNLTEESSEIKLCPEWIIHLKRKSFINENNKSCLYELAVIIENTRPGFFNWGETFKTVEWSFLENSVDININQKHEDEMGGYDLSDLETDWDLTSDRDTELAIIEVVKENLSTYKLPVKNQSPLLP